MRLPGLLSLPGRQAGHDPEFLSTSPANGILCTDLRHQLGRDPDHHGKQRVRSVTMFSVTSATVGPVTLAFDGFGVFWPHKQKSD